MNKLFAFGCSFTQYNSKCTYNGTLCTGKKEDEVNQNPGQVICWPEHLAQLLDYESHNYGRDGGANDHIIENIIKTLPKITKGLEHNNHDLVVVGLTECTRQNIQGKTIRTFEANVKKMVHDYYVDVITIQSILDSVGVDYRIFSSLNPFLELFSTYKDFIKNFIDSPLHEHINNDKMIGFPFFKEIGGYTFSQFINEKDNTYKDSTNHPTEKAHKEWAEWLYKRI